MFSDEFLKSAERIAKIGSAFYFVPETLAVGKEHGLDGFRFYFLGRGGVLGNVEASVALSAFGYFEPGLFTHMWNSARERIDPRETARLYHRCCHDFGRARFADVEGLDGFCQAAEQINAAIDETALAMYAGVNAEPVPDDLPGRAAHLAMLLREARGSLHLLSIVAKGLAPRAAHQIRRPNDGELFGWKDPLPVSDEDRAQWDAAEGLTNRLMWPSYEALDDDAKRWFVDGAERLYAAIQA